MATRTTTRYVEMAEAFSLAGCAQSLAPGTYTVETDEVLMEGLSFSAYRRVQTFIHLDRHAGRPGAGRVVSVSGEELDEAIRRGAGKSSTPVASADLSAIAPSACGAGGQKGPRA